VEAAVRRVFEAITGAILALMVLVTALDVVGRYFLNRPLPGAFELTEAAMAALIFAALPLVTARREHIVVDLFDPLLSARARRVQEALIQLACACVIFALAYIFFGVARQVQLDGLFTNVLKVPLAPVAYFCAAAMLVSGMVHLALLVAGLRKPPSGTSAS
jgi:TRAP-type C4-dicarboxylate transport system permease small subunit